MKFGYLVLPAIFWCSLCLASVDEIQVVKFNSCETLVSRDENGAPRVEVWHESKGVHDLLLRVTSIGHDRSISITEDNLQLHFLGWIVNKTNLKDKLSWEGQVSVLGTLRSPGTGSAILSKPLEPNARVYYEEKSDGSRFFKLTYDTRNGIGDWGFGIHVTEVFDTLGNFVKVYENLERSQYYINSLCGIGFGKSLTISPVKSAFTGI